MTAVVVSYSGPMDPVRVSNLGAYHLTTVSRGRHPRTIPVGISSATYNSQAYTVTLSLVRPLAKGPLSLTIAGGSVSAQNGVSLGNNVSVRVA